MRAILFGGGLSLLISLLGTRYAIRFFTRQGYGQPIRDDGPTTHHTKRGTPTMGGIVIILATVVGYFSAKAITGQAPTASALLLLFLFVGLGSVGFLDDYIKVSRQHNLGLRSRAKIIGQTLVAVIFGFLALSPALEDERGWTPASHHISFIRDYEGFALPTVLVMLLIWVIVTGTSNAVNLTDGLDGLATGRLHPGVRGLHARQHLAEQPVLRHRGRPQVLRGPRPARPGGRRGRDSPAPVSASCGGTPRRPRSSWATPARSRSAAPWRASRS